MRKFMGNLVEKRPANGDVEGKRSVPLVTMLESQNMKLPIISGDQNHYPDKPLCPICGDAKVMEPHSFAILSAGALLMDRKEDSGGTSDNMDGFLNLGWHGAHDNGEGDRRDIGCYIDIFNDVIGGQGEAYFCSTKCLRKFLNDCVDVLENRIEMEGKEFYISSEPT